LWQVSNGLAPTTGRVPRLYFGVFPKGLIKFGVRIMPIFGQDPGKFGRNKDIDLRQIAAWDVPVTTRINTKRYELVKQRASACHASQHGPPQRNPFIRFLFRRGSGTEYFARAYPPYAPGEKAETGLLGD